MKRAIFNLIPVATLGLLSIQAFGAIELVDQETKTVGATTITWDSSFEDLNYTVGQVITLDVNWTVDAGAANYNSFVLRDPKFTPKGPDPANGELLATALQQNSSTQGTSGKVQVSFRFTELHCDEERDLQNGNAHFSLVLNIDQDGDTLPESVVNYGVNVHVEDPGACAGQEGGPPSNRGGPPSNRGGPASFRGR